MLVDAGEGGADIVCLGELAEIVDPRSHPRPTIPGPATEALARYARRYRMMIVVSLTEWDAGLQYNTAVIVGRSGEILGHYRKTHLPQAEAEGGTTPGDSLPVFETDIGRIGLNICYDGTFPETARALKLAGAQLILLPTNWPNLWLKREQVRIRAYENHVNYLAVNRVGVEEGVAFHGGSMAADFRGDMVSEIGDGPGFLHVEFDMEAADANRVVELDGEYEYDYVADRRPDVYGRLTETPPAGEPSGSRLA